MRQPALIARPEVLVIQTAKQGVTPQQIQQIVAIMPERFGQL
jgi:hypothetical protein